MFRLEVGEVMAVGRKFDEAFPKALRIDGWKYARIWPLYIYIKEPGDEVKKKNLISVHNKLVWH